MKFFHKKIDEDEPEKYDVVKNDAEIEKLKELLIKASQRKNEEEKEKQEKAAQTLNSLLSQIKSAKEEYDRVVSELMPVKYELAEKKAQIEKLQHDYDAILSHIKHAKAEFDSMKLAKARPDDG